MRFVAVALVAAAGGLAYELVGGGVAGRVAAALAREVARIWT